VFSDFDVTTVGPAPDPGEPGISGATVQLTPPSGVDLGAGAGVAITTTTEPLILAT
jgi:hypothetical protein